MKRLFVFLLILFCFCFLEIGILNAASTPGTLKWIFQTGGCVQSSPAVDSDGTIYVGSYDHNVYAVNPDGSLKWEFATGGGIRSSPAIGSDGIIYVGSGDGKLYAINSDGTLEWEFAALAGVDSSPAMGLNGTIYVGSSDHNVYAVNPDGSLKWEFGAGYKVSSSPAVRLDDMVYVGSDCDMLFAINPDGVCEWNFIGLDMRSSPAIGSDNTIYVGSADDRIYAINPDGTLKWEFATGTGWDLEWAISSPVIGADNTIYVGSYDENVYAINPDGTLKWEFATGAKIRSSPAIGLDNTVYIGSRDDKVYAINSDGTLKWEFTAVAVYSSPAIGADGTIYVGADDGNLYAIHGNSGGLADSPWPMFRHDLGHTGSGGNYSPIADAGLDQEVSEGDAVTLDGSNSSDSDGSITSYSWNQTDGILVTLSDITAIQPTFTASDVSSDGASLTFELTVTDNNSLQSTDTCIVDVIDVTDVVDVISGNYSPTADAGLDQEVSEGDAVTLDGSNSSDSDGSITSYSWNQTDGILVTLSDITAIQPTFTASDVSSDGASLTFELTVTDNNSLQSTDTCIVDVIDVIKNGSNNDSGCFIATAAYGSQY